MRTSAIVILSFIAITAFGQKNFRPGYILKEADTVRGAVQYREGSAAFGKCTFQATGQTEAITYAPTEIKGFGYETRHFKSVVIRHEYQFVEIIVQGRANLLRRGQDYFVQKDTALVALTSTTTDVFISGRQYKNEDKNFANRLNGLFSDCPTFKGGLEKINLFTLSPPQVESKFSDVVSAYNTCLDGPSKKHQIAKDKKAFSWGAVTGVVMANADGYLTTLNLGTLDFKSNPSVTAGLFLDLVNPRFSEKFHFRLEANYLKAKLTATKLYPATNPTYPDDNSIVTLEYSAINVPITFGYNFSTGNFSPYLRGGFSPIFLVSKKFGRTIDYGDPSKKDYESPEFVPLVSTTLTFCLSAGADYKIGKHTTFAEVRYEPKVQMLFGSDPSNTSKVGYLKFLVGIRF
ncbi:outer membrane beta-barrel protein [Chryseolinea soli]|uniref:PorT family protein n=1 Tax=Chryseolinea soli TaxID=2321403 RepID=A0A385SQP9_9BACT|nr:outer membrane beta-barrel protein [Chryseolinea soli]AYB32295.1 PorT family protein [Chryseolinea soli]